MKKKLSTLLLLAATTLLAQDDVAPPPVDTATPSVTTNTAPAFPEPPRRSRGINPAAADPSAAPVSPGAIPPATVPGATTAPTPATVPPSRPAVVSAPAPAPVEEETVPPGYINLVGAELGQVLSTYAQLVGRSVLRSPTVGATQPIFFKNETALTKTEARQAYEVLLGMNNIAMVPVGEKFVKAVTLAEAGAAGGRVSTNSAWDLPEVGQYVSHVVQLKYVKPSEILPAVQLFARNAGGTIAIESTGMIVLRDYTENVKRMLEMIERLDVTYQSEFISKVIPIKFAKAEDIASALNSLSSGGGATTVGQRASSPGGVPTTGAGRSGLGAYAPGQPTTPGVMNTPGSTPTAQSTFSGRLDAIIRRAASTSGSGDFQIIGPNKIVADVRSNALMIFATAQDMKTIEKIIEQLDVVLAQVLIETIILDVTLTDGHNVGVSYLQKKASEVGDFTGIGAINNVGFLTGSSFSALTNGAGALGSGFSYLGRFGDDLEVTLTAVANDSSVKVVQKPRIMTSHATPATVFVGSTVPYVSGTYYGGGFGGGPSSSYQQLKVGINLTVTPYINQDGLVVMKIEEAIDEISGSVPITGVGDVPTTTSRTLSAEVAVADRETIVLGGFIRSSGTENKSGVPILKDIPILGYLFSSNSKNKARNELLVLMRPTVLRTPELAAAHTAVEKSRLPGIRSAEYESEKEETRRVKRADRRLGPSRHERAEPLPEPIHPVEPVPAKIEPSNPEPVISEPVVPPPVTPEPIPVPVTPEPVVPEPVTPAPEAIKSKDSSGRDRKGFLPVPEYKEGRDE